jgi:hypothetical protein
MYGRLETNVYTWHLCGWPLTSTAQTIIFDWGQQIVVTCLIHYPAH